MVCRRCITAVENELIKHNIQPIHIQLGEVVINDNLSIEQKDVLSHALRDLGFELLDDHKQQLIEKIKTIIVNQVHSSESSSKIVLLRLMLINCRYKFNIQTRYKVFHS